jgi:ubiquinone/menaquinone biosynthesis C-methylase UbiE
MIDSKKIHDIYEEALLKQVPQIPGGINNPQYLYIKKYISSDLNAAILDAGCGNGNFAMQFAKEGYKNIHGIDLFSNINTDLFHYEKASLEQLPYDNDFFDFIYCNSAIYFLNNPENGIKEFRRVAKTGAKLFMTAHTKYSLFTLKRILFCKLGFKKYNQFKGMKFYSAGEFRTMLENNGYKIILVDSFKLSFLIVPAFRMFKAALNKFFKLNISLENNAITRLKVIARIKSVFAYHSILVAEKI